ncbi:MAG: indole-3-glycerol phosphate synthase TrpC [Dehalococcoidia bacterium]|nr:indole-3-glycerol phosphate synthase TrpC [Dehalococcoidia bacterium]MDW8120657.1 indole-3-glycerol phosphate synthase TrpC [Chloroflexota bacterium]
MPTILEAILQEKRREVDAQKGRLPLAHLERQVAGLPPPLNLSGALWGPPVRLMAEVKRASPSKGALNPHLDPVALATTYAHSGAAAISVLTDRHFQGSLDDLRRVAEAVHPLGIPVLRKDFILDVYQLYEARAAGADGVLLIVAALTQEELTALLREAGRLWLQCLVEVHTEAEMERALAAGAEIIGINNRDLHTFHTDLAVTERLAPRVPRGKVVVSESGIATRQDVVRVQRAGVHAILVGEALVTSPDPAAKIRELLGKA